MPKPVSGVILNVLQCVEQVLSQPVVTHRAVVTLNVGILLRIARLNKYQLNALVLCPHSKLVADVLRTIITSNRAWFSTPFNDQIQNIE